MASPLGIALAQTQQPMAPGRPGAVAPTDVGNIVSQSQDAAYKNYAAHLQQQNAMFGGLAGLGGAGVLSFGPKLSGYLFGSSGAAPTALGAAGAGSGDAAGTALGTLGSTAFDAGSSAVPYLAAGGADALGGVAAADAAATAAPVAAEAGAASLADLLPFLFLA